MLSESARNLFIEMMPLTPEMRSERLRQSAADEGETKELLALLRALDGSPGFLEVPSLAWTASADEAPRIMPEFGAGARFGSFTLVREVGRGGMGVVYEARQERPRRRVALKLMRPGPYSRSDLARFKREAEALGRLNHPHIAAVHEARMLPADGGGEHTPYIAMEFIEGRTIAEHVRETGIGTREIVRLMVDACDAAAHAHEAGIVHRDLSVSNVLVERTGRVKIVDFGVARLAGADAAGSLASVGGHVFGKWATMSPEQAAGDPARIDARADVFALGAVLYELLAGRPWLDDRGRSAFQLVRAVEREEPVPIGTLRREARGDLQAVIATAMNKDRMRRYQSAADLRDELMRWLEGLPVHAREPGTLERAGRFASQNRALVGTAAGALVVLAVALAFATAQWVRASRNENRLRETVRTVLDNVVSKMTRTRHSVEVRAGALREVKPALDQLLAASPDDPDVRLLATKYYTNLAMVEGYAYLTNLGNRETALEYFRRAIEVAAPGGIEVAPSEECAVAALDAGNMLLISLLLLNRTEEARALLDRFVPACESWMARGGDTPRWLRVRAWMTGNELILAHATAEGERIPALLAEMRGRLLTFPTDGLTPRAAKDIGEAWLTLASSAGRCGACEEVPGDCERMRPLLRRWAESPEADGDDRLNYLDSYRYEVRCLTALGRSAEAQAPAEEAVRLARDLPARYPERMNMHIALVAVLQEAAETLAALKDVRAVEFADESAALASQMPIEAGSGREHHAVREANAHATAARVASDLIRAGVTTDASGRDLRAVALSHLRAAEGQFEHLDPSSTRNTISQTIASVRASLN